MKPISYFQMDNEDQGFSSMIEPEEEDGCDSEDCTFSHLGQGQNIGEVVLPSSNSTVDLDRVESEGQDSECESVIGKINKKLKKNAKEESQHGLNST